MYGSGSGVSRNPAQAAEHYRVAAGLGEVSAQFNLGVMYEHGHGVPPSGVLSSARGSRADYGQVIYETVCAGLANAVRAEFPLPKG